MPDDDDPRLHIRVDSELKRQVGVAAELEGLSTSEFVREQLRDAAGHIDLDRIDPAEQ